MPTGTVTFLFTDIEGSTKLYQDFPAAMPLALTRHHEILNHAIAAHNGYVFQIIGDGFHAAFPSALEGVSAALDAQRALVTEAWGEQGPIRVRMALHTDHAEVNIENYTSGDYVSSEYLFLAHTARLLSAGHGGQILLSARTAELVRPQLPPQLDLRDLGMHRVKDFESQQIYQVIASDLPSGFPALKTLGSLPNNLPIQLTSFVGREKEIQDLKEELACSRLLTLTGPGGAGKTRLSLQVAADQIDRFKHGVWFVELAPVSDPALVPQTVATTLNLHEQTGRTIVQVLQEYVNDKQMLLVLDNCEHLVEACAQLADSLLRRAPDLKILASSREALGIVGESTYPIPPLSIPTPALESRGDVGIQELEAFEAVRLFVDRAKAVQPAFKLTEQNAPALARICRRLDGIPLALELAAARVKGLTVEQIDSRLDDRFRLLTAGNRTAMPRHQTLQATIEWSYALLSAPERVLLQRLAVFADGWTLQAAEFVCRDDGRGTGRTKADARGRSSSDHPSVRDGGPHSTFVVHPPSSVRRQDSSPVLRPASNLRPPSLVLLQSDVLDILMRLVDKSLVVVEQQQDAARYHFLDSIRQFADDKLAASGPGHGSLVRDLHLDFFLNHVETIDQTLRGAEQESGLAALDSELDNLRTALTWSAKSGNVQAELRLASALWRYWRVRSYFSEGRGWLEDAIARSENGSSLARAKAMLGAGSLANYQSDYPRAAQLLEASLALHRQLDDRQGAALCLNLLSHGRMMTGDFEGAKEALDESLAIFVELDDTRGMGYSLYFMGSMFMASGDLDAASPVLEESLMHLKAAGDTWWVGNALIQLGWCTNRQGEPARALQLLDEALDISAQFGDTRGMARALLYIGEAQVSQNDFAAARSKYGEALKLFNEIGDRWWATVCLEGLAHIAAHANDALRVARLLGAAEHIHELLGAPVLPAYREGNDRNAAWARARLSPQDFSRAWNEGRALTFDEAVRVGMSE